MIFVILKFPQTSVQKRSIFNLVSEKIGYKTRREGNSLLHLAAIKTNIPTYWLGAGELKHVTVFPSVPVALFLLSCGANVNATNKDGYSPLLLALKTAPENFEMAEVLLAAGARVDQTTIFGEKPSDFLPRFNILNYVNLQCLAASVIRENDIGQVPRHLESFIEWV